MDGEPTSIGRVIDDAMRNLLGDEAFDSYVVLCRQTAETRQKIEEEVRGLFPRFLTEELGDSQNHVAMTTMGVEARMRAEQRVQQELGRRMSQEHLAFQERCNALLRWAEGRRENPISGG